MRETKHRTRMFVFLLVKKKIISFCCSSSCCSLYPLTVGFHEKTNTYDVSFDLINNLNFSLYVIC